MKNRKQKELEYDLKYSHIPKDYNERLVYMYDLYKITDNKANHILNKRIDMMNSLYYTPIKVILYEEPAGYVRNRFRLINRHNLINEAINNSAFVHVYSPNAAEDRNHMKRLYDQELYNLNSIIYTPCDITYDAFLPTPKAFNIDDTILSEVGVIRPILKPDADNIAKKYMDMFNQIIYQDDVLVNDLSVHKYYSILPRLEINLLFLNMLYNKQQYNSMQKKLPDQEILYYGKEVKG